MVCGEVRCGVVWCGVGMTFGFDIYFFFIEKKNNPGMHNLWHGHILSETIKQFAKVQGSIQALGELFWEFEVRMLTKF